ncbi:PLP-dependent aminotransferase family protein [Kibdelosporangium aridum]|uniref:PLP-dependent aminotransferase family protein n=1 Tax=Kibdelosporangium aridum TaxID=2030 RepID=A0A428Z4Q6_KIBAR|nr:PLP-dependent aminotransferase family protein [Kibdelosporangium aridum]RSM81609.1 PLP-dependent aminotransferase family protein [Kibdelosporangium aridum]
MSTFVSAPALAQRTNSLAASAIGSILRLADSADMVALAAGSPAPETFCATEVAEVVAELLASGPHSLQYGDTEGLWSLREWIAAEQTALVGRQVSPDGIVMAHGSQQALDLICKALIDPGDVIVVDRPSYIGALQVFQLYQPELVSVPIASDEGLDQLQSLMDGGLRPKMLYIVPNFANPSGLTLSRGQREKLADLAARHGFAIVEDDPYGKLGFTDEVSRLPALAALSDAVIRIESFSKSLFPAARLGYMTAPQGLVDVLQKFKQAADLGNSQFVERIVHGLVTRPGLLDGLLVRSRALYSDRRDTLISSLRGHLGDRLRFATPDGGFFLWAGLPDGTDATRLLTEALTSDVSFVPGAGFFADHPDVATLRLSYSCASPERLTAAGPRLAAALDRIAP